MTKRSKPAGSPAPNNSLEVAKLDNEASGSATARTILAPAFRHAVAASQVLKPQFGSMDGSPGYADYTNAMRARGDAAAKGDLAFTSRVLSAQAVTLDTIFTEMARRMALNMSEYLPATETYARIALKAQAQSRTTLEALAKLHQPREQTVRHVHVNEGGQAVIADQFHNHLGGTENDKSVKQSNATGTAGQVPALLGQDPLGNGVPIPGREREKALQNARRHESGCA